MHRIRWFVPVLVMATALGACSGGKNGSKSKFDAAGELAKVKQARAELNTTREKLAAVKSQVAELKDSAKLTDDQKAKLAELEGQLKTLQSGYDDAFASDQTALANFLNVALNEMPQAPETREALRLYADEAIRNAQDFIDQAGNYGKALDLLQTSKGYFDAVNLPVPDDLAKAIDTAQTMRFLSQDRFDKVQKGMTFDEVKAVTGTPFYANVHEQEVRGKKITTWLFNRADQGVAAIYFEKGKVYATQWDLKKK